MPTTYNGIGTHYYGKKGLVARAGVCRSCHRAADLISYDTRLWFVIVFIPVIPLGRKRVIDECRSCRRHMVANADAYEEAKQLQTSGSLEQFRRDPSPEAALGAHAQLLDFLEEPGAGRIHSLNPIDSLSTFYQRQGRHEEALEIGEHLLREIPEAGGQHQFRSFILRSERALRRPASILPPRAYSLGGLFRSEGSPYSPGVRKLFLGGVAATLLAAGLIINNEYIRRNRTIHVVNACGAPVRVRVDGGPPVTIAGGLGRLTVAEGHHRLEVGGAATETREVDLRSGLFERWTHKPLWVFNPGGEAACVESTIYYARNPPPNERRPVVGRPFFEASHVDYPFEAPPASLRVKGKDSRIVKTAFEWVQGRDVPIFLAALREDREDALAFAERRLRRDPGGEDLLKYYLGAVADADPRRAEAFLKAGLDRRPARVQWHRAYQSFAERGGREGEVLALYDRLLAAAPGDAALIYLRGRIDPDDARQEEFYRRSIAADPRLPWPWMARGVQAGNRANWPEALESLRKARELGLDEDMVREPLHVARLGAGEAEAMATEYRARLASAPRDPLAVVLLADALAASGKADEIEPAVAAWLDRLPGADQAEIRGPLRAFTLYQAGRAGESEKACLASPPLRSAAIRAQALAALGRAGEAAADGSLAKAGDDPWSGLALALGLALEGKADEATAWRARAAGKLETLSPEARSVAKSLGAAGPTAPDDLIRLSLMPQEKALVFAVLAGRFPDRAAEYLGAAGRYNLRRTAPYLLIRRAIEAGAGARP